MLQTFIPVFVMTFFICLFIVLMQFLWRYIDDLVGKGLEINVIGELFFYAALTMVPMALPLAILLASLMTFGNLGEKFELTAMKASGVSLLKTMRPLIILILLIAGGAFFFQNNILPVAQVKMWTLLHSMKQKSPEMEIPEKAFYDQIPGISIYVDEKDKETGILRELMIYDMSGGTENTRIIVADSGKISVQPLPECSQTTCPTDARLSHRKISSSLSTPTSTVWTNRRCASNMSGRISRSYTQPLTQCRRESTA